MPPNKESYILLTMPAQETTIHTARWVLPVTSPPLPDGAVVVQGKTIQAVGPRPTLVKEHKGRIISHENAVLFPGLVNAHTHLEFSALKGSIEKCDSFPQWLKRIAWRRILLSQKRIVEAAKEGVEELVKFGTALVADVANLTDTGQLLDGKPLAGLIFHELIGLNSEKAEEVFNRCAQTVAAYRPSPSVVHSISPHSPYTVSPALFQKIKAHCQKSALVTVVHLAESREEVELCLKGSGPLKDLLNKAGVWDKNWKVPKASPVDYLDQLGFLDGYTLAVHLTQATLADVKVLAQRNVSICLCVRSNEFTGVGRPPVRLFTDAGLNICLGTDSLASNWDLNILNEMRAVKEIAPELSLEAILSMGTINGARALGFDHRLGSLEPGKDAFILALPLGPEGDDPYQALFAADGPPKRVAP